MITFLLGGARSGKSEIAERLASSSAAETGGTVTYLATMRAGYDAEVDRRIAAHRDRRPPSWRTIEVVGDMSGDRARTDLAAVLTGLAGTVLLDSLGPYVAAQQDFSVDTERLCAALAERDGDTVIVSDEVGLGVSPATEVGGAFRDALGSVNQAIAAVADRTLFVVAGQVLALDPPPER